jgi:hypothetical protein
MTSGRTGGVNAGPYDAISLRNGREYASSAVKMAATRTRRVVPPKTCWKIRHVSQKRRAVNCAFVSPRAIACSSAQLPWGKLNPLDQISFEYSTYTNKSLRSGAKTGFACGASYGFTPSLPKRISFASRAMKSSLAR